MTDATRVEDWPRCRDGGCTLHVGHSGPCNAIPNSAAKLPYQGESAYYRHLEQERKDAELGRATRNRAADVLTDALGAFNGWDRGLHTAIATEQARWLEENGYEVVKRGW